MTDRPPPEPAHPWDPGLQPERSSAAWSRTALAASIVAVLVTRTSAATVGVVAGLLGLALAAVLSLLASRRIRSAISRLHAGKGIRPALPEVAAMAALAAALPGIALIVTLRGG